MAAVLIPGWTGSSGYAQDVFPGPERQSQVTAPKVVSISLPVYGQASYGDLIAQAELLASQEVARQFGNDVALAAVQIVVNYDYNGEIVPLLNVRVSRSEWQLAPQTIARAASYSTAYQLFSRHDPDAEAPPAPAVAREVVPSNQLSQEQFERAFDEGRLTEAEINRNLDYLD